jgi:arginyl-tRNA synthetase
MFMWRSAPESWSFTQLVSQAVSKIDTKARFGPLDGLREALLSTAEELAGRFPIGGGLADRRGAIALERPPRADFGDYSTNAALLLAPGLGAAPREVAQRLGEALQSRLPTSLERFEVAGPGFLNLFLEDSWFVQALAGVLLAADVYGAGATATPEHVLIEFVSANPTGPMHVGHARNAAYGDALARVLAFYGHRVEREFYVNDAGSQVRKLGESVQALARGEEVAEDGYRGDYVARLVHLVKTDATDAAELGRAAVSVMVGEMQASLAAFAVQDFDRWAYESALHEGDSSRVDHALSILEQQGHTYRSEGALWLRTTDYGDDKDRVLVRSSGEHTYFASDIAYHQDKRERGFDRQIDVWGADHHGYVARMKAAYAALGGDPDQLELLIMQLVHLVRRGERAQMSKRAGEFVTLDELLQEIGVDATRWYLLARSHDTTVDLDLDLAREQSSENPVYYVQYAHARIASVLAKAGEERVQAALAEIEGEGGSGVAGALNGGGALNGPEATGGAEVPGGAVPLDPAERALIKQLLAFPAEVAEAAERRAPHRIAAYALELAQSFTAFYRDCHVLGAEPETVESLRIALCVASRRTIARSLDLLGVSAPEEM